MIKNIFNKVKNYTQKVNSKIDYYFEACQINHTPDVGERTGFIEGSNLRSPDGVIWTVEDGKFALKENPSIVDLVIAEKWSSVLPTTMVPGGSVPFVNVK